MASKSAKILARGIGALRVHPNKRYRQRNNDMVINWGSSENPSWRRGKIYNKPESVSIACNKLRAFEEMNFAGVNTVPFTSDREEAMEWNKVVVRHLLTSHSGGGIEICDPEEDGLPYAPLYTKFIPKRHEYRVHVWGDGVLDVQEKRFRRDFDPEDRDIRVRNHQNGWVFCREDVNPPDEVLQQSIKAVKALDLDFGAVDIIVGRDREVYVVEVNTACGLEGTTLEKYKEKINSLCR